MTVANSYTKHTSWINKDMNFLNMSYIGMVEVMYLVFESKSHSLVFTFEVPILLQRFGFNKRVKEILPLV